MPSTTPQFADAPATRCPESHQSQQEPTGQRAISYACAMKCPVLTQRIPPPGTDTQRIPPPARRACYAMPATYTSSFS
eukprot:2121305-Rhodomonas_salina.4